MKTLHKAIHKRQPGCEHDDSLGRNVSIKPHAPAAGIKRLATAPLGFYVGLLACFVLLPGCNRLGHLHNEKQKALLSFSRFKGITYYEVSRHMKNGLSFTLDGYQLEPEWQIRFESDKVAGIYSTTAKSYTNYPITPGNDSVFNIIRTWLKVKSASKDSLVFEVLTPSDGYLQLVNNEVTMVFYADQFLKRLGAKSVADLRRPSRKDSLLIQKLTNGANRDIRKAFSAKDPVKLISKSPYVKVKRRASKPDAFNNYQTSDDYLYPTFEVAIKKAYSNFNCSFSACVDTAGNLHYEKPLIGFFDDDNRDAYIRLSKGIMDGYLKYYVQAVPGKTLNLPHPSTIYVHVKGEMR